jgi:sigma-B regulation protein RsbU (phosphoserine phosphatase)
MESQNGLYFTMTYGVLDLKARRLQYVVAGHPPAVLLSAGAEPRFMPGGGFPIGMMEDIPYEESTLTLASGDRLYLYSDGVPEAMNADLTQFTNERMLASLTASQQGPFDASVDQLFSAVRDWCRPHGPKDDVTILGITIPA